MDRKGYRKLKLWEKANEMAIQVYKVTKKFPKEELYGLTSQVRRAAVSVPTNIVEGHASKSRKDFLNFLNTSNKSLVELEYLLSLAFDVEILPKEDFVMLEERRRETAIILSAFIKGLNKLDFDSVTL